MRSTDAQSTAPSVSELVQRARQGNADALTRLYEEHVDGLYAFVLYRVGGDQHLAEDVVQETFLQALDQLERFDPGRGSFSTWLCVTSRNVIRHHLRANRRAEELQAMWDRIDSALAQVFASLEEAPLSDEVLARAETREFVQLSIAQLPERYRDALKQHYLEGASLRDMTARMQITEDAAKSLLARARRAFRDTFATLARAAMEAKP
jgi:RNA polymerase sigma-70 factor (ECF subfamily)